MLKKLVHYFTSRSLDKHLQKTQCMIDEYEREAAASQARVQAQADAYKLQIQQLAKLREDELKQYVEFLNDHIEKTTDYIDHLKDLPQAMFLCVEAWLRKNISELRWNLERDKTQVIRSTISYLDELNQEMIRLSRAEERRTWQAQIANRPPRVTTPEITKLVKQFARDAKSDAKDYERDLSRIKSYQSKLRKQLSDLRISTSGLKAEKERNSEQHQFVRQRVKALYEQCGTKFIALQDIFENYYQFSDSDSPLANLWISQMPNGGTLREINQVLIDTRPDWEDAKRRTSDLKHRRTIIQTRIKWAHDFKEFSTLDADKEARSEIVHSLAAAREHQDNFFKARQVFTSRRDEIKKLMGWINDLHPSKTIEQVFTLLSRDDTDIYWPAIGLATKSVRHPARRQQ